MALLLLRMSRRKTVMKRMSYQKYETSLKWMNIFHWILNLSQVSQTLKITMQYKKIATIPIEEIERFALRTFSAQLPEPD